MLRCGLTKLTFGFSVAKVLLDVCEKEKKKQRKKKIRSNKIILATNDMWRFDIATYTWNAVSTADPWPVARYFCLLSFFFCLVFSFFIC